MRWVALGTLVALLGLVMVALASAGWIGRQLGEWHEMSYCTASPPGDELRRRASGVGHRWTWQFGWPPGRWTCVYRDRHGRLLGSRAVP